MICENEEKAKEDLGEATADKLKSRLADLLAAKNVNELFAGFPEEITFQSQPSYKLDLIEKYQIIFCSNHNKTPLLSSGNVDWNNVSYIKIQAIDKNVTEFK
ncbi:MAG: putative killer suppression protein HigA [Mucilaginibacter sp.]|nr:putative killer suppression protein HigA [Mucilaginibacter sp.]